MPSLDQVTKKDLQEAANQGKLKYFDCRSFGKYTRHVNINNYKPVCGGEGGKCFLVDKHTGLLGLISKGVGLVKYHEENAATKCNFNQQMIMTPLLYGPDRHLNASLVPANCVGTQEVWWSLQARYHEDPNRPGEWDRDEHKCDRYVQKYVIVAKVKRDKFDCVLLRRANHSHFNTFETLQKYEQELQKYAQEAETHKRLMAAKTQSVECVRKLLQDKTAKSEKHKDLIDTKTAEIEELQNEKSQNSSKIEKLRQDLDLEKRAHTFEKNRKDGEREHYRGNPSRLGAPQPRAPLNAGATSRIKKKMRQQPKEYTIDQLRGN